MDSESMPNFKRKKKKFVGIKNQMKNMSKEAVKAALVKKKQCNDRAIEIVNLLIETDISEETLLGCLYDINQSHFDDIVEERAITKLCGYPLCSNSLTHVPNKQFQISTKTNKVYDITERKNYCSNLCYKASKYLKDQLYTSPLWLREHEDPVSFRLLPFTVNSGSSGEEIDFGATRLTLDDANKSTEDFCISDNEDLQVRVDNIVDTFAETVIRDEMVCEQEFTPQVSVCQQQVPVCDNKEETVEISTKLEAMELSEEVGDSKSEIKIIRESVSSESIQVKNKPFKKSQKPVRKPVSPKEIIIKIETTMRSWFTFETFCFLLGEQKIKNELDKYGLQLQQSQNKDPFFYDRYADLCKRLNLLELEETYGTKDIESPKKPLPDFDKLKDESKQLEIKVNSFFKGTMEFEINEAQEELVSDELPVLPPLDHYATKATRRRIFLQKLCRTLPDIQIALGLTVTNISHQIKEFVATFNLTAQNISLKPSEWNVVAIVFIKLLSLRDDSLKESLTSKKASNYLELILMSYSLDSGYLDRLVIWLLDIEYLINLNQSQPSTSASLV